MVCAPNGFCHAGCTCGSCWCGRCPGCEKCQPTAYPCGNCGVCGCQWCGICESCCKCGHHSYIDAGRGGHTNNGHGYIYACRTGCGASYSLPGGSLDDCCQCVGQHDPAGDIYCDGEHTDYSKVDGAYVNGHLAYKFCSRCSEKAYQLGVHMKGNCSNCHPKQDHNTNTNESQHTGAGHKCTVKGFSCPDRSTCMTEPGNQPYYGKSDVCSLCKTPVNIFTNNSGKTIDPAALSKMNEYYNSNSSLKAWIDDSANKPCIFAFEGLGIDTSGGGNTYHDYMYAALIVVTRGKSIVYKTDRASTLPEYPPPTVAGGYNTATIRSGVHEYYTGNHGSAYIALRDARENTEGYYTTPIWTVSNGLFIAKNDGGGLNIHVGGPNRISTSNPDKAWSAGCTLVHYLDYVDFGKAVGFLKGNTPNLTQYLRDQIAAAIGTYSPNSGYGLAVNVKYICDRSEMLPKHKNRLCPYPEIAGQNFIPI